MGKITVKHYLNKDLNSRIRGNVETYPLYVQIIANRNNYKMKSSFDIGEGYLSDSDFEQDYIKSVISKEKGDIEKIVSYIIDNEIEKYKNANSFRVLNANLWDRLNTNFWKYFNNESVKSLSSKIPNVFVNQSYVDIFHTIFYLKSEIFEDLSDEFGKASLGMSIFYECTWCGKDLEMGRISVFDFMFGDKREYVREKIKDFYYSDDECDYKKIMMALESMIFFE